MEMYEEEEKRQATISSLIDNQGEYIYNPDLMGKVMLDYLSQIIGKEDSPSPRIKESRAKLLATTPSLVDSRRAKYLERPFTLEECWLVLKKLGKENH